MIELEFTKGKGKTDWIRVQSKDFLQHLNNPKQGIIPHDMVHYAVEKVYGTHGFIRLLVAGKVANFTPLAFSETEAWHQEGLVEVFQAELLSGPTSEEHFLELANSISEQRNYQTSPCL